MIDEEEGCLVVVCTVVEVVWQEVEDSSPGMLQGADTAPSLTSLRSKASL